MAASPTFDIGDNIFPCNPEHTLLLFRVLLLVTFVPSYFFTSEGSKLTFLDTHRILAWPHVDLYKTNILVGVVKVSVI